jgi:hypothetical protein
VRSVSGRSPILASLAKKPTGAAVSRFGRNERNAEAETR